MTQPSAEEQYLLELINSERAKLGAQPLVFNGYLNDASEAHTHWMIATDNFSHVGSGGTSPDQRMSLAGYTFTGSWSWGENIAWITTGLPLGSQDEVQAVHSNLLNSPGHRANILNDEFREIGLGFEIGDYGGLESAFVTEDFARSGSSIWLTGVVFDDSDGDHSYDPGEGVGGVTVTIVSGVGAHYVITTMDAGGYGLALPSGDYSVTFSGAGIATITDQVLIGSKNVKVDLMTGALPPPPIDLSAASQTTYNAMYGVAPSALELNSLIQFSTNQATYGSAIHVQDVTVYVYEALGLALSDGNTFVGKYSPNLVPSDQAFCAQVYIDVFHHAGTQEQVQHFLEQVNFFSALYMTSGAYGTDPIHIDELARAAVYGQMLGIAAVSPSAVYPATLASGGTGGANAMHANEPLIGISATLDDMYIFA